MSGEAAMTDTERRDIGGGVGGGPSGRGAAGRVGWCWSALVLAAAIGCSHQERYGRDPKELAHKAPRTDAQVIAQAKAEATQEQSEPGEEDTSPVAVLFVNGDPITVEDVLKWIRYDLEQWAREMSPAQYGQKLLDTARNEIRSRAESQLLYQTAMRRLTEEETKKLEEIVDGRMRETVNRQHGGRQSRFEAWLKQRGLTLADERERVRRETIVLIYLQRMVQPKIAEPTRRELEELYEQYLTSLRDTQRRRMQLVEVAIGAEDGRGRSVSPPVSVEEARAKAVAAKRRLDAGEDFAAVARECSEGINAPSGGDWGWVKKEGVKPRWAPAVEALYGMVDGAISGIVETDQAFFIVRCAGIEQEQPESFGDVQAKLLEQYRNQQFDRLTRVLIADLYSKAMVRPANAGRFLRAVLEAAPQPSGAPG